MNINIIFLTLLLLGSSVSYAKPTLNGSIVSWPDNGWYQVLDESNYSEVCAGGSSCTLDSGSYLIINHTTGERFPGINVEESADAISVTDNTISWPDDGWYQVQDAVNYQTVCEGGTSCEVPNGIYTVINHTTGLRNEEVRVQTVGSAPATIEVIGNTL